MNANNGPKILLQQICLKRVCKPATPFVARVANPLPKLKIFVINL